jgi:hypothetical protein
MNGSYAREAEKHLTSGCQRAAPVLVSEGPTAGGGVWFSTVDPGVPLGPGLGATWVVFHGPHVRIATARMNATAITANLRKLSTRCLKPNTLRLLEFLKGFVSFFAVCSRRIVAVRCRERLSFSDKCGNPLSLPIMNPVEAKMTKPVAVVFRAMNDSRRPARGSARIIWRSLFGGHLF